MSGKYNIRIRMVNKQPIFQSVFGGQWHELPPVMHKHYANRPFSRDVVTAKGIMKVEISNFARILMPFLRFSGTLVPYEGDNIPVTVHFRSDPASNSFIFDRIFSFPGRKPVIFRSRMIPAGKNRMIEFMRIGIAWLAGFDFDGQYVRMSHEGYTFSLFGKLLPLPLEWLIGKGEAFEQALDDDSFLMDMKIRHPLWGTVYGYSGTFTIMAINLEPV